MVRLIPMFYFAVMVLLLAAWVAVPAAQDNGSQRPRILVTNDDGIDSPGLRVLVKELAQFADVTVCAPASNRSGASQSVSYFSGPMLVRDAEIEGAVKAVAVDGTPADAAHFGIVQLGKDQPFDLLISGMNRGSNVGDVAHGSGTVGAAMEGAYRGIPSIAVSTSSRLRDLAAAAAFARRFAQQWLERGVDAGVVYSINLPNKSDDGWKGVRAAPMGGSYLSAASYRVVEQTERGIIYRADVQIAHQFPIGSDSEAYMDGSITITPLRFDWTDRQALADLADWDFDSK